MPERYAVLIPLRGGSKGIPDKNIALMAGRPLCAWAIDAACASRRVAEVAVSTDSEKIKDVVNSLGLPVRIIDRPASLATDASSTESVMLHAMESLSCTVLITMQATSPLTTAEDLDLAIERFESEGFDSMVTGVRQHRFVWNDNGTPLNYDPRSRPRRQDWAGSIIENGAFYLTRRELLLQTGSRLGGRIGVHVMPEDTYAEIDEPSDWPLVEALLCRQMNGWKRRPKVLVCDVDGTLTDGGMYYDQNGEALKRFDTRDARGLAKLRDAGMKVWVITAERSAVVEARMKKLGLSQVYLGVRDKWPLLCELLMEHEIDATDCAYMGDDDGDLECLKRVGWAACPADAQLVIRAACNWVAPQTAGHGAVRSFCEYLLTLEP